MEKERVLSWFGRLFLLALTLLILSGLHAERYTKLCLFLLVMVLLFQDCFKKKKRRQADAEQF